MSGFSPRRHSVVMVTDEDLLERSLGGDARAFGVLVERHASAVCAVSFAVTGDQGVSEDVAQDAFLAAWTSLPTLREPSRFKAWACGIARNLARKARGRVRSDAVDADPADASPNVEELIDAADREAAVWAALAQLSPTYREPLVLYYREGRSTKQVAEALGLAVSTVEQRLSRGRKHLRAEVMDMVERTLEDRPEPGRISAAVVGAIEVGGIPVGESAPVSDGPSPTTSSQTMKIALISTAAVAALGLGVAALSSSTDAPEVAAASGAAGAPEPNPGQDADAKRSSAVPSTLDADPANVRPAAGAADEPSTRGTQSADLVEAPFELTRLGPAVVAVNLRGGKSEMTTIPIQAKPPAVVGHLEGLVVDPQGRPVEGAVVLGGPHVTITLGTGIASKAGVVTDADGTFELPVYSAGQQAILAAHHEHGMSRVVAASTQDVETTLRVEAFAVVEGTVREGEGGVPARVGLRGTRKPLVVFGGPTHEDGSYRFGPLPPGTYTGTANTALEDRGNVTTFPDENVTLRPGESTKLDFMAREGAMLVLEAEIRESDASRVYFAVFPGTLEITSYAEFQRQVKDTPRADFEWLMRGGVDASDGTANFHALEPGTYTGCIGVKVEDEASGRVDCEVVDLGERGTKVLELTPKPE